jgi:hypothetical protein
MRHDVLVARTKRWPVAAATPDGVSGLLRQSRQLYVYGLYNYENFADAAAKSMQAVEAALKLKLGAKDSFFKLIEKAGAQGLLSDEERDHLHAGRQLRNRLVHVEAQPIWTPALAAEIVAASHEVIARLSPTDA